MTSDPRAYADAFRRTLAEAEALAGGLSAEAFNWKPPGGGWSVGECLFHLTAIAEGYLPRFEAVLERGGSAGAPPFRYGPVARFFIRATGPQATRKTRTLRAMDPGRLRGASTLDRERVLRDFRAKTARLLGVLGGAEGLDLARARMSSPFLAVLRLPIGAFLEGLAGHERRHLAQARRVTEHPGFPV